MGPDVSATVAPLRVVLICHHDAPIHNEGLARWIASWATLAGVVVIREPGNVLVRRLKRERERIGLLRLVDVFAFRLYYRFAHASRDVQWLSARLEEMRQDYPAPPDGTPTIDVSSPNSPAAEAFIRQARPDMVLALCKNILAERVFSIPRFGTFVFHPGICPEYRNAHGCFWALASGDTERVGMTLLRIDRGIDTGPVLGWFGAHFDEERDTHIVIQHQVVLDNLDRIRDSLLALAKNGERPLDTSGRASREWGQPWLTAYWKWKSAARRRRSQSADRRA
jgi:hypothetical protein